MEGLFRQIGIYSPNGQQYTHRTVEAGCLLQRRRERPRFCRKKVSTSWAQARIWLRRPLTAPTILPMILHLLLYVPGFPLYRRPVLAAGDQRKLALRSSGASGRRYAERRRSAARVIHSHISVSDCSRTVSLTIRLTHTKLRCHTR